MEKDREFKFGLIGYPLGHSLSPILYKAAFKELGINGTYELFQTESEILVDRIKRLRANGYYGFNVTIPHKIPTTLFLSKYDENVNMTGAVNTVRIEKDLTLTGYNTDVHGFMEPLKSYDLKDAYVVVLGTGGAARAVCAGLYKLGVKKIDIYTRNIINSKDIMNTLRARFPNIDFELIQYSMMKNLNDVDMIVNTTPVGMKNFSENLSIVDDKYLQTLKDDAIIYDIVYNPLQTALISKAIKYNKRYISGLDMLIHQACKAVEIWIDKKPDWKLMKIAALEDMVLHKNSSLI